MEQSILILRVTLRQGIKNTIQVSSGRQKDKKTLQNVVQFDQIATINCSKLIQLHFVKYPITDDNCSTLITADWPYLKILNFGSSQYNQHNLITSKGCKIIAGARWPQLSQLLLGNNKIGDEGCKFISKGKWPKMKIIKINRAQVTTLGVSYLRQSDWHYLNRIELENNNFGSEGCSLMINKDRLVFQKSGYDLQDTIDIEKSIPEAMINWKFLRIVNIAGNSIGNNGCMYLCRAKWNSLVRMNISNNRIGDEGCEYLVRAQWKKLKTLEIGNSTDKQIINNLTFSGVVGLGRNCWPNFSKLSKQILPHKNAVIDKIRNKGFVSFYWKQKILLFSS